MSGFQCHTPRTSNGQSCPLSPPKNTRPRTPPAPRQQKCPLQLAIEHFPENIKGLKLALDDNPENVFLRLANGDSALPYAAKAGRSHLFLKELINARASVNDLDRQKKTALDILLSSNVKKQLMNPFTDIMADPALLFEKGFMFDHASQTHNVKAVLTLLAHGTPCSSDAVGEGNAMCALVMKEYRDALNTAHLHRAIPRNLLDEDPWLNIIKYVWMPR